MDKSVLITMFITFATSNDILTNQPRDLPATGLHDNHSTNTNWPPKFCNKNDCPKFTVVETTDEYEERIYEESMWVSTNMTGIGYMGAKSTMFMKLFRYIRGNNEKGKKIDMTCPVTNRVNQAQGLNGEPDFIVSFYISPKVSQAPAPVDKNVYLKKESNLHVYVRQFGGFTDDFKAWAVEAKKLKEALNSRGLQYEDKYYYTAGYDAPFKILNRHNEIWFIKK